MASFNLRKKACECIIYTRIYPLNPSRSKNVMVGLVPQSHGVFTPVVRIINQTGCGITLTEESFATFTVRLPQIRAYLARKKSVDEDEGTTIYFEGVTIKLTKSYGGRSVVMDQDNPDNDTSEHSEDSDAEAQPQLPVKRRKLFTPSIIMHRITFDQLEHLLPCIERQLKHLHGVASLAVSVQKAIIDHVVSQYGSNQAVLKTKNFLHQFIIGINEDILQKARTMGNVDLPTEYLDAMSQELLSLNIDNIVKHALKAM